MKVSEKTLAQTWRFIRITLLALLPLIVKENLVTGKWAIWAGVVVAALSGTAEVVLRSNKVRPVIETNLVNEHLDTQVQNTIQVSLTAPEPTVVSYPPLPDFVDNDYHQSPKGW